MYASCRSVSVNPRRQKTASVTKFAQTAQHVAYEFIWIRRTCDYIPLNVHYYVLFGTMAKVELELGLDLMPGRLVVMHTYLCDYRL